MQADTLIGKSVRRNNRTNYCIHITVFIMIWTINMEKIKLIKISYFDVNLNDSILVSLLIYF